jgi:septal ring factor EnvC (AmiA/AmiB activator)
MMDQRMENLKKINRSVKHLNARIAQLEDAKVKLESQQQVNSDILAKISEPLPEHGEPLAEDDVPAIRGVA